MYRMGSMNVGIASILVKWKTIEGDLQLDRCFDELIERKELDFLFVITHLKKMHVIIVNDRESLIKKYPNTDCVNLNCSIVTRLGLTLKVDNDEYKVYRMKDGKGLSRKVMRPILDSIFNQFE